MPSNLMAIGEATKSSPEARIRKLQKQLAMDINSSHHLGAGQSGML